MSRNPAQHSPRTGPYYITLQSCGYCFRYVLPPDMRLLVGKWELRYSLRNGHLSEARYKAREAVACLQRLIRQLRKDERLKQLTKAEIQGVSGLYLRAQLDGIEEAMIDHGNWDDQDHDEQIKFSESLIGDVRQEPGTADFTWSHDEVTD